MTTPPPPYQPENSGGHPLPPEHQYYSQPQPYAYQQQPQQAHSAPGSPHSQTAPVPPYAQEPPAVSASKKRRWPWVVVGVLGVLVVGSALGGKTPPAPTVAAAPTTAPAPTFDAGPLLAIPESGSGAPTSARPVVTTVTLPEVKGRNGGIVYDELIALGLTKLELASRDTNDTVVLLPANWTAVRIEPAAGTKVKTNQTVVVTMTKK